MHEHAVSEDLLEQRNPGGCEVDDVDLAIERARKISGEREPIDLGGGLDGHVDVRRRSGSPSRMRTEEERELDVGSPGESSGKPLSRQFHFLERSTKTAAEKRVLAPHDRALER